MFTHASDRGVDGLDLVRANGDATRRGTFFKLSGGQHRYGDMVTAPR
jgi:hypothetical protein